MRSKLLLLTLLLILVGSLPAAQIVLNGSPSEKPKSSAPAQTTILSETLEMVSTPEENIFYFSNNVRVNANTLRVQSDKMVVTTKRDADIIPGTAKSDSSAKNQVGSPDVGTIEKIVASGNVRIYQENRESSSGKAEFFPREGKVVLTENPRVIDAKAIVSGWRITLFQNERRVMVEENPEGSTRPTVNLSNLPDLGTLQRQSQPTQPAPPEPAPSAPPQPPVRAITLPASQPSLELFPQQQ